MSIALLIGKIVQKFCHCLSRNAGMALPGLIALKLQPTLINQIVKKNKLRSIIISGTNGKTTTSRLLSKVFELQHIKFIHNRTGSNLLRGIASTLINQTNIFTQLKAEWAIWEVDEAAVKAAVKQLRPRLILFTNLSRDQLDRYGEIDTVLKSWQKSLALLPKSAQVITNRNLAKHLAKRKLITFRQLPPGQYQQSNILAVKTLTQALKLKPNLVNRATKQFKPAFGRGEIFKINQEKYQILLAKNPAGLNALWQMLAEKKQLQQPLLLILNDRIADGTDVSWIWDVQFNYLNKRKKPIIACGTRAHDMALRLKYAGLSEKLIILQPNIALAFRRLRSLPGKTKYILPTYTAMLALRQLLYQQKIVHSSWQD